MFGRSGDGKVAGYAPRPASFLSFPTPPPPGPFPSSSFVPLPYPAVRPARLCTFFDHAAAKKVPKNTAGTGIAIALLFSARDYIPAASLRKGRGLKPKNKKSLIYPVAVRP